MTKHELASKGENLLSSVAWRLFYKAGGAFIGLVGMALLAVLVWQGKNMGYALVAQSPALAEVSLAAAQANAAALTAQQTASDAKSAASLVASKVDSIVRSESEIVKALQQTHTDHTSDLQALATITQQITDIKETVVRVENKQDAQK